MKLDIQVLHDGGKQLILRLEASEKRTLRGEVVAFMLLPALLPIPVFHQTGSVVACAIAFMLCTALSTLRVTELVRTSFEEIRFDGQQVTGCMLMLRRTRESDVNEIEELKRIKTGGRTWYRIEFRTGVRIQFHASLTDRKVAEEFFEAIAEAAPPEAG